MRSRSPRLQTVDGIDESLPAGKCVLERITHQSARLARCAMLGAKAKQKVRRLLTINITRKTRDSTLAGSASGDAIRSSGYNPYVE